MKTKKTTKPDTSALKAAKKQPLKPRPSLATMETKRKASKLKAVPDAVPTPVEPTTVETPAVGGGVLVAFRPKDFNCADFQNPLSWVDELAAGLAPVLGVRAVRIGKANVGFYAEQSLADHACTIYGLLRQAEWHHYNVDRDGQPFSRSYQNDFLRGYARGIGDQSLPGEEEAAARVPVPDQTLLRLPTEIDSTAFLRGRRHGRDEHLDEQSLRTTYFPPKPAKVPKEPKARKKKAEAAPAAETPASE